MKLPLSMALAILLASPIIARAQQTPVARQAGSARKLTVADTSVPEADAIKLMEYALRRLVLAEEKYWRDHGSYTADMAALGIFVRGRGLSRDSAWAQVVLAGSTGWTGMARHPALPGKSCVIQINPASQLPVVRTAKQQKEPRSDGLPICDDAEKK